MKVRHYRISGELLIMALAEGTEHRVRVARGLPEDGLVLGVYGEANGVIVVVVESESFEDIRAHQEQPFGEIVFEAIHEPKV